MKTQKKVLTILPNKSNTDSYADDINKKLFMSGIFSITDADGEVYLQSSVFEEIFGMTKKMSNDKVKRLAIVKIEGTGKPIYRAFKSGSIKGLTKDYVGLTSNSLYLLSDATGNFPDNVELSPGKYIPFYWQHPDKAIRISVKLGFLSLFLGLLSIVISIVLGIK